LKIEVREITELIILDFDLLTLEQFLERNNVSESYAWCNGYLVFFTFMNEEEFDKQNMKGIRIYRAVDIAPMPIYETEVATRYTKKPVFDFSGNKIMEKVVEYVKNGSH